MSLIAISLRILVPDFSVPIGLPSLAGTGEDDESVRARSAQIARRYNEAITESVQELADLELVKAASAEVRVYRTSPLFKLYLINGAEAFFGFYNVLEHKVMIDGESTGIFDAMGKDTVLFHFDSNEDETSIGSQYVREGERWFDSVWNSIATGLSQ